MTEALRPRLVPTGTVIRIAVLFGLSAILWVPAAPVAPDFSRDLVLEGQGAVRVFGMGSVVEPLVELTGLVRRNLDGMATGTVAGSRLGSYVSYNPGPAQVRAGAYVKVFPGWRVGAFYSLALGVVHEDDWTNFLYGSGSDWGWQQGVNRPEHLVTLDITHRAPIPGAPGLSGEIKGRSIWNLTWGTAEIMVRPGLYFTPTTGDDAPTLFLQNETWLRPYDVPGTSLKEMVLWENWLYGGVQVNLGESTQLGLSLAWKHAEWHDGPFWWKVTVTAPYRKGYDALVPGISLTHRINL